MSRLKELEEKILDRSATEAEVVEYDDLKHSRTTFEKPVQTVEEFIKGNLQEKIDKEQGNE